MARDILWRDTGLTPKIGPLDARAVFPLGVWLFHWSTGTAILAVSCILALYLVQRTGMPPVACLRYLRMRLVGRRRESSANERQWRIRCRW